MSLAYTCDKCEKPLKEPVYQLTTIYNTETMAVRTSHYHWKCLKEYMAAE